LRLILSLLVVTIISLSASAHGEEFNMGVKIFPEKIMKNSEGVLQIYASYNSHIFPKKISDLVYSSSDSSIVKILGIDNDTGSFTHLRIKAMNLGTANIKLVAPGFASKEIPIKVYDDPDSPSNLSVKITPDIFTDNGPQIGHISVEIMNKDKQPVFATNDTLITLTTNPDMINLHNSQIIIKTGNYFAVDEFDVKHGGIADITASSKNINSASGTVNIQIHGQQVLKSYVFPENINNFAASVAYVIVQLQDASGNPVLASEDIAIPLKTTNSSKIKTVNTSDDNAYIESHMPITIKKGSYWGYAPVTVKAGINGTFNVDISSNKGYLISTPAQFTTTSTKFFDDKSARLDTVPILKTGKKELIGILHLEDSDGKPVIAKYNLPVEIDSSDINSLAVDKPVLLEGSGATPVFGIANVNSANLPTLHVVSYTDQTISPSLISTSDSIKLNAEPLINKILKDTLFPFSFYATNNLGALEYFTQDLNPVVSSDGVVFSASPKIQNGDFTTISNATLSGNNATLIISDNKTQTVVPLESTSHKPSKISLQFIDPLSVNSNNTSIVQLLDSANNPMFADKDITLKIVPSNNSVNIPQNVTIKKGEYYKTIEIFPHTDGQAKISLLSDNIQPSEYTINVEDTKPQITLNVPDQIQPNNSFLATAKVQLYNITLNRMNVNWTSTGATIQQKDLVTNQDGIANALFLPTDKRVILSTSVSGVGVTPEKITKIIQMNTTSNSENMTTGFRPKTFGINGIDPIPILIIGSIATGGIALKRKNIGNIFKKKINIKKK